MTNTVRESVDLLTIFVMQLLTVGVVAAVGLMILTDLVSPLGVVVEFILFGLALMATTTAGYVWSNR